MHTADSKIFERISDPLIRKGVEAAIKNSILPAIREKAYPGHFMITAAGNAFGSENTWPGLDSWEMAGAILALDKLEVVENYFKFVRASQRSDGNIPFAIIAPNDFDEQNYKKTAYWQLKYPEDKFYYDVNGEKKWWVGLYIHWQAIANPLSVLGPISHLLVAWEIYEKNRSIDWLRDNMTSIEAAANYILTRKSGKGFIGGSGFYIELPPRNHWDGITQCYGIKAFRQLSEMFTATGETRKAQKWSGEAEELKRRFCETFWTGRHFAEYIHLNMGVIDRRKLTDVDLAAIGLDVCEPWQAEAVWEQIKADDTLWYGDMPTHIVSIPFTYEKWELNEDGLPFELWSFPTYDVAAMGRVWYLDTLATLKMGDKERLIEAVRKVCARGLADGGYWHERYHARPDGTVESKGPQGYCEYAAILVRTVFNNPDIFMK